MRKLMFLFFTAALTLTACDTADNEQDVDATDTLSTETVMVEDTDGQYGEEITAANAVAVTEVPQMAAGKDSFEVKVKGTVEEVCQKKGCWMTMDMGNGEKMRVVFKDYGFFVPKDISGETAVIEGTVYRKTTSVDDLRHYAEDEGKSEEEIAAITEPKEELEFVADGVLMM